MRHFVLLSLFLQFVTYSYSQEDLENNIIIIADYSNVPNIKEAIKDKITIYTMDMEGKSPKPQIESLVPGVFGEIYIWRIQTNHAKSLNGAVLGLRDGNFVLPGDSIHIHFKNSLPEFSGKGAVKFQVQYAIEQVQKKIKDPVPNKHKKGALIISLAEYLQLSKYYDELIYVSLSILESYKPKLNGWEYKCLKVRMIELIETKRLAAFNVASIGSSKWGIPNVPIENLTVAWDSTFYKPWATWLRSQHNTPFISTSYYYDFARGEVWRKFNWTIVSSADTLASKPMRVKMYYDQLVKNYSGSLLEQTLALELLDEEVIQEMGSWSPVAQRLLKDYYKRSKLPAYKKWVQSQEAKTQYFSSHINYGTLPFFQLLDDKGNLFTEKDIKGKFTVINFWYSGCKDCKSKVSSLQTQLNKFANDSNVLFLNVCVDEDRKLWLKNKGTGVYAPKEGIHLYTGPLGKNHEMVKDLNITQYPSVRLVDTDNVMVITGSVEPDITKNRGQWLENIIKLKKSYSDDGPYVLTKNGSVKAYYINNGKVNEVSSPSQFKTATDVIDKDFSFFLQAQTTIPLCEYLMPEKMMVLSDIEGNFSAFRKLLQANKVIDENFNWNFGKGHLVFAGDMFDRGEQVTECLWLIYSLEEKARKAGGVVHFILGNHEIMNLSGNDKYVVNKYKSNYKLLGKTVAEIYGEDSELGQWLRTKNIVEKIGDNLFCHGGISPYVNDLDITLEEINTIARPYYARSEEAQKNADPVINTLYHDYKSPFWYRHYYKTDHFSKSKNQLFEKASEAQIDSTCQKFDVHRIITGHTIIADTISTHFNGKVINTDVHHASGKSEALLVEGNHYYRVNGEGRRVLLFTERKKEIKK